MSQSRYSTRRNTNPNNSRSHRDHDFANFGDPAEKDLRRNPTSSIPAKTEEHGSGSLENALKEIGHMVMEQEEYCKFISLSFENSPQVRPRRSDIDLEAFSKGIEIPFEEVKTLLTSKLGVK